MPTLFTSKYVAVATTPKEVAKAKQEYACQYIVYEKGATLTVYENVYVDWIERKYSLSGKQDATNADVTGTMAYQKFYSYAGKEEVERMKHILEPIENWDSCEQMHYSNVHYQGEKIYKPLYNFDANSAFTYGVFGLPSGFNTLKDYMSMLYEAKKIAKNKLERDTFKKLQNFLIGYFARVKGFVSTRSEVIRISNDNITSKMKEITRAGGTVYLSNTDSIVTDDKGAEIMSKYIGDDAGRFKLEGAYDKLYYRSSNSYQIGNKVVWSGVKEFARINTDFFSDRIATQEGNLVKVVSFMLPTEHYGEVRLCTIEPSAVIVKVFNSIGELMEVLKYRINKEELC